MTVKSDRSESRRLLEMQRLWEEPKIKLKDNGLDYFGRVGALVE
jgi:hypothetical protein